MKLTKKIRAIVLEKIRSGDQIIDIADAVGVTRQALYWLKINDVEFGKEWEEAAEIGQMIQLSECEKEADFRGRIGYLEPKFYEGNVCGFVKKYSDTLLQLRLKALAPEKYGDKTKVDGNLNLGIAGAVIVPGVMTPESWERHAGQFDSLGPPPMPDDPAEEEAGAD